MKEITKVKNPIKADGANLLSPSDWLQQIGWVVMIGAVFALGSKALSAADKFVPGVITPTAMQTATGAVNVPDGTVVY